MGQNFDDYPGFQQTPGMPILLQHSVKSYFANQKVFLHSKILFPSLISKKLT